MLHMLPLSLIALLPLTTSVWAAPACSVRVASSTASATAAASSATGSVQTSGNSNSTNGRVALAWYAGWSASTSPPSGLSWSKYTHMQFSFGITAPGGQVSLELSDEDGTVLPNFVKVAQQNSVKAILTIGGWTGSQYFSSAVATNDSRAQFIDTLTGLVTKYDLDGLDFDWEYPNALGIGCNEKSPQDTENYLQFLTELRATDVMQGKVMSAATSITPFFDSNGQPSSDVSGFAKVLDHISIMNYDVYGNWSSADGVGPLAPLDDTCGVPGQLGSATSAVKLWTDAGFPASQIVLGVAAYGRSFFVTDADATATSNSATSNSSLEALPQGAFAIAAYPSFNPAQQPMGDSRDANGTDTDICGVTTTGPSGVWNFDGMIGSFLSEDGTALPGIGFRYDDCSQTPYVYNKTTQTMVSYDDPTSFAAKGKFIADKGLAGFAVWEASGDYKDLLVDSIRSASGM